MAADTDPLDLSQSSTENTQQNSQQNSAQNQNAGGNPGAGTNPDATGTPNPPGGPDELRYYQRARHDEIERRTMRLIMYTVVLLFAIIFLGNGLNFALNVGDGLLTAKKDIVKALTGKEEKQCIIPLKCITEAAQTTPPPAVNATQTKDAAVIASLNTDWLSASSLIAIVAFILGVGLTLILTLLKATYQHPTDKDLKKSDDSSSIELATPLSQLIERAISYIKEKFSK